MILSSPFSRQNKAHQTWHHQATANGHTANGQANGYLPQATSGPQTAKSAPLPRHQLYSSASLRKPAPQQPAPQRPVVQQQQQQFRPNGVSRSGAQSSPVTALPASNRASTLNRLDVLKRRQQQLQQQQAPSSTSTTTTLRRNLSSLGHYPSPGDPARPTTNGFAAPQARREPPIYAPASIASPRELAHHRETALDSPEPRQQHYAATSVHLEPPGRPQSVAASTGSGRPESALGQLWQRFGTLRRKAGWRKWPGGRSWSRASSSSRHPGRAETPQSQIYAPASIAGYPAAPTSHRSAGSVSGRAPGLAPAIAAPAPGQPLVLDPEIYAPGKRQVEPEAIYAEGLHALESNAERRLLEHELDPELMAEGETRTLVEEQSQRQPDFRRLVATLTGWLNDELAPERIIVRHLQDDLHDGQVLGKLLERLHGLQLDLVEVTQNELAQRHKLQAVLGTFNRILGGSQSARSWARIRWSVEGIHGKNLIEILHLLITMALFYRAPLRLPANVSATVLVFQRHQGELVRRGHQVELTDEFVSTALDQLDQRPPEPASRLLGAGASATPIGLLQRDAFDTLIESAPPAKLAVVKQSLVRFCNRHLAKVNMSCQRPQLGELATDHPNSHHHHHLPPAGDLDPHQFSDGLLLVFLISALEDYFVPLGNLFTRVTSTPTGGRCTGSPLAHVDANNNHPPAREPVEQPTALEPTSYVNTQPIEKLHNVNVALQLMEEAGLADIRRRVRAEEIVNGDLKAVLRVLYALFSRYKHL